LVVGEHDRPLSGPASRVKPCPVRDRRRRPKAGLYATQAACFTSTGPLTTTGGGHSPGFASSGLSRLQVHAVARAGLRAPGAAALWDRKQRTSREPLGRGSHPLFRPPPLATCIPVLGQAIEEASDGHRHAFAHQPRHRLSPRASALRSRAANLLVAAAAWVGRGAEAPSASESELLPTLDRLAQLDAEMHRLRVTRPAGWANSLAVYAAEAKQLRQAMALEFRRDDRGLVFLVRGESALYHLPS
jgi:hypothetical protein